MTPNPKPKRLKLTPVEYRKLKKDACERAMGYCEYCKCTPAPLDNGAVPAGHPHHIKSRKSGGDDSLDNILWVCWVCHTNIHNGTISRDKVKQAHSEITGKEW